MLNAFIIASMENEKKKERKKTSVQLVVVTLGGRVIEHAENFDLMELLFACTEPILFSKKKNKI